MATLRRACPRRGLARAAQQVLRPLFALWAGTMSACGDAVVDSTFRGDAPLWLIPGEVQANDFTAPLPRNLRVALFWSPRGPREMSLDNYLEQAATSIAVSVPSYFNLGVFDLPGAEHLITRAPGPPSNPPRMSTTPYAIGRMLAYSDDNGNQLRDPAEPIQGLLRDAAFLYAPTDVPAGQSAISGVLAAGFHRSAIPELCGRPVPAPLTPGDCGVPLGESCVGDQDCGQGGVCILNLPSPWPGGACAIPEPPPSGCRPAAGTYYLVPSARPNGPSAYWLKSCTQDSDCLRTGPVRRSAYLCDPGWHACLPPNPNLILVGMSPLVIPAICQAP